MTSEPEHLVDFGDACRQKEFAEKYISFLQEVDRLRVVWERTFEQSDTTTEDGRTVTYMTRMAIEDDFFAIVLLCANGHSNGSKQILRALFEKVVTVGYLHNNPKQLERFKNYSWIHQRKKVDRIGPALAGRLKKEGQANIKEIKEEAKKLKDEYGKVGWSDVGTVQMAREIGIPFQMVETGYYWGLVEAHPTDEAIRNRVKVDKDGSVWYEVLPSLNECRTPLLTAHYFVLVGIEFLAEHFEVTEVKEVLPKCWESFNKL